MIDERLERRLQEIKERKFAMCDFIERERAAMYFWFFMNFPPSPLELLFFWLDLRRLRKFEKKLRGLDKDILRLQKEVRGEWIDKN